MNLFRNLPIKRRLTLIAVAASGVGLLFAAIALLRYEQLSSNNSLVDELHTIAAILGDNSAAALAFGDVGSAAQTLGSLHANPDILGAAVYTVEGSIFASYSNSSNLAAKHFTPPQVQVDGHRFGDDSLEVFHKISLAGETIGTVYVRANLSELRQKLRRYAAVVAALFLVATVVALLMSAILLAPIARPISQLSKLVARVAEHKDYSVRAVKESDDELGRLSDGFNAMLQQIELRDQELRSSRDLLEQRVAERTQVLRREVAERRHAEVALRTSEASLSAALTMARAAYWEYDLVQDRFTFNDHFYELFRTTANQVGGYTMSAADYTRRFVHPDDAGIFARATQSALEAKVTGYSEQIEHRIVYADNSTGYVTVRFYINKDEQGRTVRTYGVNQDISERKQSEHALQRLNRALQTLSAATSAVVHATNEEDLLQNMCRTIVDAGHYRMAWVGIADSDAAKTVRPVASAGDVSDYLSRAAITWGGDERGQGPAGTCIRSGKTQVVKHIASDPAMTPWRDAAAQRGFLSAIALPLRNDFGVYGALAIYAAEADAFDADEVSLLTDMAGDLSYGIAALHTHAAHDDNLHRLERSMEGTVRSLASVVEMRDPYTAGHQRRVASLAVQIGKLLGLGEDRLHGLSLGASIHDIGKIKVPSEILSKPGKLSIMEFELIKLHPASGAEILKDVEFPWPISEMVLQHHERIDGGGYPQGLKGEQIILEARIIAVADVVEAMSSHRPYRPGKGIDAALAEIIHGRGNGFDASAVDACLKLFNEQHFQFPA